MKTIYVINSIRRQANSLTVIGVTFLFFVLACTANGNKKQIEENWNVILTKFQSCDTTDLKKYMTDNAVNKAFLNIPGVKNCEYLKSLAGAYRNLSPTITVENANTAKLLIGKNEKSLFRFIKDGTRWKLDTYQLPL